MSNSAQTAHEEIQRKIVDFFSYFSEFYSTRNRILRPIQDEALKVHRLREKLTAIQEANIAATPLGNIPNFKPRISYLIVCDINASLKALRDRAARLTKVRDTIKNKEGNLRVAALAVNFESQCTLVDGSPHQPRLADLLKYAADASASVNSLANQVGDFVKNITEDSETDEVLLVEAFKLNPILIQRLDEIYAMTMHVKKNEILE